jgi:hypothetical protein
VSEALVAGGNYETLGFRVDKGVGGHQFDCARQHRASRYSRVLTSSLLIGIRGRGVVFPLHLFRLRAPAQAIMHTAGSILLLLIFAVLIFGVPILLIAIRLIEAISEMRESARQAEGESAVEENPAVEMKPPTEKKPINDAGEWTPARRLR